MCPDTEDLLSINDAAAPAQLVAHVRDCAVCQEEVAALEAQRARLRALPPVAAPPPSAAVLHGAPSRRRPRVAAAAAAVVCAAAAALWMSGGSVTTQEPAVEIVMDMAPTNAAPDALKAELAVLTLRSAVLERQWQILNRNAPRVQRAAHEVTTAPLKSGLMQLDARYDDLPAHKYWRQRVQLLDTLVTLERTERLVRNDAPFGARPAGARML